MRRKRRRKHFWSFRYSVRKREREIVLVVSSFFSLCVLVSGFLKFVSLSLSLFYKLRVLRISLSLSLFLSLSGARSSRCA